jgi:hypothetical protein
MGILFLHGKFELKIYFLKWQKETYFEAISKYESIIMGKYYKRLVDTIRSSLLLMVIYKAQKHYNYIQSILNRRLLKCQTNKLGW